ncbi:alpha/beta hydrolase [Thiomicrospira microaerophila]|uniref:alpha/beta hydrolase n=1 Tax=Thiomicrospira microaerophila TaxID=406020 RepID=UPI0005C8495F|nr:alpha/beta fold hydrolase [Thiomicrospira microaerophila]
MYIKCKAFFLLWMGAAVLSVVQAQTVSLELRPGFYLQAAYDQPQHNDKRVAVLVQHGFLTTNQFHTIRSIVQAINDLGLSALSPNMSYGISERRDSLKCDSLHTHTLEDNRMEINAWVDWLVAQGYEHIVLLGHSSGSQDLLFSQATEPHSAVALLIVTSVFYFNGEGVGAKASDWSRARHMMLTGSPRPASFSLLFCQDNFYATPQSLLSYSQLTRQQNLANFAYIAVPVHAIMGTSDEILQNVGVDWLDDLVRVGVEMHLIDGANHFFSSLHEFDLQERLLTILTAFNAERN